MSIVNKIYKQNYVHTLFYGFVAGCRKAGITKSLFCLALDFSEEIDNSLDEETLVRYWYNTQKNVINNKKTKV